MRYEDDFGSYWTVDDAEFVRRRHLSRGRPRKYEPQNSSNGNANSENEEDLDMKSEFQPEADRVKVKSQLVESLNILTI